VTFNLAFQFHALGRVRNAANITLLNLKSNSNSKYYSAYRKLHDHKLEN